MPKTVKKSPKASPPSNATLTHKGVKASSLTLPTPDVCGVDIGATSHLPPVLANRDAELVKAFPAFTADLEGLVRWLRQCAITAVTIESTGAYKIPLFEMLDATGFEVQLVNAYHLGTVPGRKSDVLDCQWRP